MKYYLTGKQAQAVDKYTQEKLGVPGLTLMESAAGKLAEAIDDVIKHASEYAEKAENLWCSAGYKKLSGIVQGKTENEIKILSVVESGNNGGDAVAAAWMLKDMGYNTYITEINGISRKTDSYVAEIERAKEHGVTFTDVTDDLSDYSIVIDGIFGVGLTRDVKGIQKEFVDKLNKASFVVGVDIPSGISADNGHVLGAAVKCDMTVTFEYVKYGMLINEGREYSGIIRCEKIGLFVPESISEMAAVFKEENIGMLDSPGDAEAAKREIDGIYINYEFDPSEVAEILPERRADSNKGTYGKVLIIAGSKDIYGAVYMAAEAAYRVGAGLVKVVTDIRNRDLLCDKLPEAMILTYDSDEFKKGFRKSGFSPEFTEEFKVSVKWADVILCGPGLGTGEVSVSLIDILSDSLKEGQKLILDADALNIISMKSVDNKSDKIPDDKISGITPSKWFKDITLKVGLGNVIITPHMMEMLRLVKAEYNKDTFDFMIKGLAVKSEMEFLKEFKKSQAYNLSYNSGIITVLKDARTIVTYKNMGDDSPSKAGYLEECPIYVNSTGNSGMSKGGSGDVLAGMIAGLLAGNKAGKCTNSQVVCAAVNLHGRAGDMARDRLGERSMLARDILDAIPEVLKNS